MSGAAWLAYLAAISALIISPGPSALLVLRTASSLGFVAAIRVILGGSLSALILICVSLAGLARLAGEDLLGLLLHSQIVLVWVLVDLVIMLGYAWFARHQRLLDGRQLSRCCAVLLGAFGSAALLLETQPLYAHLSAL